MAQDRTRFLDVPDVVESGLHRLEERIDGPKEDDDTDTDEQAALRRFQVALHHRHDRWYQVRLAEERGVQMLLDDVHYAETFGYCHDHGQDGHDGKDERVGEGLGGVVEVLAGETACHEHDRTDNAVTDALGFGV